jgi:DeoR/GlpR family transcriptional regulator of sugar metabolism
LSFDVRRGLRSAEKQRIGAAAAAMVQDGEAISLDASTTALAVANQLHGFHELTVITNGIFIALALLNRPGITVLLPGGFLRRDSVSLIGVDGHELISKFYFQKGFFGAKGLTLQEGLTDVNRDEVLAKRDMVAHAKQVIAVVDSSKWGQVGFVSFAAIEDLDTVITDRGAPQEMVAALREASVHVMIV